MGDAWAQLHTHQLLHEGASSTVYRATRASDDRRVVVKVLKTAFDDAVHRARLQRELTIASQIDGASAIRAYGVTSHEGRFALVLEDFGGDSLDRTMSRSAPALEVALPIACSIASALAGVHRAGIIHRDLKPANVIHRPSTGEIKISDFGLAVHRDDMAAADSDRGQAAIEGTLEYMAPEQSGRMQMRLDHRADLYAFGVLLYELFTGRRPFQANDALEWIHCHAAQRPRPLFEVDARVPVTLSNIVLKLLAKAPDERYQSAEGVGRDLARCEKEWQTSRTIGVFALGEADGSDQFRLSSRVFGRERDVETLRETFGRVADVRRSEVLLISGYSGIGKTSLVRELEGPVAKRRGYFAAGKFDQVRLHVPYSAVVQAGNALVEQLLAASSERLDAWREALLDGIGGNARVLIDLFPALERVLGAQPTVAALPPAGMQNRLHHAARVFIRAFEVPVVLFFDDMQWADAASLDLLDALLGSSERADVALLAVLAYRDHEVSESHPLRELIDRLSASGAAVGAMVVRPLDRDGVRRMVRDTLQTDDASCGVLADLAMAKTAGNPFFVREFLRTLHIDGLLKFDPSRRAWGFDARAVEAKKITENVVHLMMDRLTQLAPAAREALRIGAFLGDEFDVAELALLMGRERASVLDVLRAAVEQGLVTVHAAADGSSRARFGHDRIQQAAYALTPDGDKHEVHLAVGRLLWRGLGDEPAPGSERPALRVFEVANHLDAAFALIVDPAEREALLHLFLGAARKARGATAYAQARTYLARASELLSEDDWESRFDLAFDTHLELAECAYLAGHLDNARSMFVELLARARSDLERARVYYLQIHFLQVVGDLAQAAVLSLRSFALLGLNPPESDEDAVRVVEEQHRVVADLLGQRPIAERVDDPPMTDPAIRMLVDLLEASGPPIYMVRPALFSWVALQLVAHSLRYGNAEASCYGYGIYAILRAAVLGDVEGGVAFSRLAIRLNEKLGAVKLEGCMLHLLGDHVNFWKNPIATDLPILERGFSACVRGGDNIYSNYIGFQAPWHLYESGAPLVDVMALTEKYASFARVTKYAPVVWTLRAEQQFIRMWMGAPAAGALTSDDFDQEVALAAVTEARFGCGIVYIHILDLVARYTFGDFDGALLASERARAELSSAFSMPIFVTHALYEALTMAALHASSDDATRAQHLVAITGHHRAMLGWAEACPANFADKVALVGAELARMSGDVPRALGLYEAARLAARGQGFVQYEALACELAAKVYEAIGVESVRRALVADAHALYSRWGASAKAEALLGRGRGLESGALGGSGPRSSASASAPTTTESRTARELDLTSVLKAAQSLSAEIVLPRLLPRLMAIVVEYAGAQRGSLLLAEPEGLLVTAEAAIDGSAGLLACAPRPLSAFPASVLRYVERTAQHVVIDDAASSNQFGSDPYFASGGRRSVLCKPIRRQGRLIGIFYLENDLVAGAFGASRLATLEVLASQTAISIENSRLYEASQAAVCARDEFLAIASHELKTPLAPLAMQVHRLTAAVSKGTLRTMPDSALNNLAFTCQAQIQRMNRLIGALLDVSRIESGTMSLHRERFDLGALVSDLVESHAPEIAAAGCELSVTVEPGIVGEWDKVRLEQAVSNLLSNALKFGRGKLVEVRVFRARGTERERARRGVSVVVSDHGVGVRECDRERVFQRFERVQSSDNVDGLGLGLFIVRAIVEAHNGRVRVEPRNASASGASFRIDLPVG